MGPGINLKPLTVTLILVQNESMKDKPPPFSVNYDRTLTYQSPKTLLLSCMPQQDTVKIITKPKKSETSFNIA